MFDGYRHSLLNRDGAISVAVSLSRPADILSGPVALLIARPSSTVCISAVVRHSSDIIGGSVVWSRSSSSGRSSVENTDAKHLLKRLAYFLWVLSYRSTWRLCIRFNRCACRRRSRYKIWEVARLWVLFQDGSETLWVSVFLRLKGAEKVIAVFSEHVLNFWS